MLLLTLKHSVLEMIMLLVIVLLSSLSAAYTLKILAVLPFPMKSHHIVFNPLLAELVTRGHQVTVYSNTPLSSNASNYRHVYVTSVLETVLEKKYSFEVIKHTAELKAFFRPMGFQFLTKNLSEEALNIPQIKDLLHSNEKYDVVILEIFFGQEALIGFGHRFDAPVVCLSSFGSYSLIDTVMGNPNPIAYFSTYQLAYSSDLTFYQRLKNVIATLSELHYSYLHHLPMQQAILDKHFKNQGPTPLPPLKDLLANIAIVLLNIQPEVSYSRPWLPNMISVGGLHINPQRETISKEIQKFIDGTVNGFIYFSLGSTFSGASLPDYIKESFTTAFERIPLRVLWKIDIPPLELPANVMAVKWVHQNEILAHPKCRLFITHGGLLSLLEAVHFAVPLIGAPVFADQPANIVKAEQAGIGVRLRLLDISAEAVTRTINEVLNDKKYKRNIDQLSAQMRDKLVSPLDTAVYWVEYVAKHRGASHLRSPARKMSYIQYLLIDVFLFLLTIAFLILLIIYIIFIKIFRFTSLLLCKANKYKKE